MRINRFEDLEAWKKAHELAIKIYRLTDSFPKEEKYALTDQIRRSASSVSANIAEGYGRYTFKEYVNFLVFARGSATETQSHLHLAKDVGYISREQFDKLYDGYEETVKVINGLIRYLRSRAANRQSSNKRENSDQ
jgi:four helix bundle protein